MTTLRDNLLPVFDQVRALMDTLGLRRYDILMRTKAWSGARVGLGTPTVVDTAITLDGTHRIKVLRVTSRDIIASPGKYQEGDFKIGPITPTFASGGRDPSYFTPASAGLEIFYRLTGPGFPTGAWFKKVDEVLDKNFSYFFTLRAISVAP